MHDPTAQYSVADGTGDGEPLAYSVKQLAKKLAITERYAWALVSGGTIPSFKVGKSRRISARALREFVEQQEREAAL